MRIGFATSDFSPTEDNAFSVGGTGHYRVIIPAFGLKEYGGHEVFVGVLSIHPQTGELGVLEPENIPYNKDAPDKLRLEIEAVHRTNWNLDVIILQRWMHIDIVERIAQAKANGQIVINDIDDLFESLPTTNRAYHVTHPKFNEKENRNHYKKCLKNSNLLTVSTDYMAERYAYLGVPTVVLRNRIQFDFFRQHTSEQPPRLGWVGGTAWRAGDLETLQGVVLQFLDGRQYSRIFSHGGHAEWADQVEDLLKIPKDRITTKPLAHIPDYPELFDFVDVGTVPLSTHPFNSAKSYLKGLEYMASGIPFISGDSPEYHWLKNNYDCGRVARKGKDWIRHLKQLANDDIRQEEAEKQLKVAETFDIKYHWQEWEQAYKSII